MAKKENVQPYLTHNAKVVRINLPSALDDMMISATRVWNTVDYWARRFYRETGTAPTKYEMRKIADRNTKYWGLLPSKVAEAVVFEYYGNRESYFTTKKNGTVENARLPGARKQDSFSTIKFNTEVFKILDEKTLRLSISNNISRTKEFILIEFEARHDIDLSTLKEVKVSKRDGNYVLGLVVKYKKEKPTGTEYAAIDLGIKNIAAIAYSNGKSTLIPSSWIHSQDYYFRKEIAKLQAKGKTRKAKELHSKLSGRKRAFFHTLTKQIIDEMVENNVKTLIVGDLTGIRKGKDYGNNGNSKLHGWNFAEITRQLAYKGAQRGVEVFKTKETYTSQTCAKCGTRSKSNRTNRGLYVCKECGYVQNADINGAINILRKGISEMRLNGESIGFDMTPDVWHWNTEENRFNVITREYRMKQDREK